MTNRATLYLSIIAIMLALSWNQGAAQGRFGAGVVFGEPTGIAFKYRIDSRNGVDGALGFVPADRFRLHVDYLWQTHPFETANLAIHYGVGPAIAFGRTDYVFLRGNAYAFRNQDAGFAVRIPVGLTYTIPRTPLDAFLEVAPLLIFTPGTGMGLDVGIGARVYP